MKWPETWLCSSSLNDLLTKASHAPCTTCLVSLVPEDSPEKCDKLREEVSQVCTFTNFLYVFVCFALLLLLCVISSSSYISLLSSRETLSLFYCLLVRYRFVVCVVLRNYWIIKFMCVMLILLHTCCHADTYDWYVRNKWAKKFLMSPIKIC